MVISFFKNKLFNSADSKQFSDNNGDKEGIINLMALLVEASSVDGKIDDIESSKIIEIISKYFKIEKNIINEYYNQAYLKQKENTSFHNFTSKIHKTYSHRQKIDILEMLWEVVLVNKKIHDFESSLMRRICGLLHLKDVDSGMVRKKIIKKLQLD
tara:strand:- start:115 stop:582 length:468 start_codon:yes stop_codon:yes gene_type:complete